MVEKGLWLSMRHFMTHEYLNDIYMGQQQCKICNTELQNGSLIEDLSQCTIFASTLLRSKQTVDFMLSKYHNIDFKVIFSENLIERGLGDFEGKKKSYIRSNRNFFINDKFNVEKTPPNGESLIDFRLRVNNEVKIIKNEFKHSNILVISHLQVLRMIRFCVLERYDYVNWHNINYIHGEVVREKYGKE